jgi:hypothetical protein
MLASLTTLTWGQSPYTLESAALKKTVPIPIALRNSLDPRGSRIVTSAHGVKVTLCEAWLSKTVFTYSKPTGPSNALYGNLERATLLGLIYFPNEIDDGRDQKLRPGYYTMRYVQMPQSKAHENVNTYPDFVALSPAASDVKSHETLPLQTLILLSRRASQTTHAAILGMAPANQALEEVPAVTVDDSNQCVLELKVNAKTSGAKATQEIRLAIVVARQEGEGS